MKPVAIVSPKNSSGSKLLANRLQDFDVDVVVSQFPLSDRFNVGWGRSIGSVVDGVNRRLPPNKLHELKVCEDAGVKTVPFTIRWEDAVGIAFREPSCPVWGRLLNHTRGTDIVRWLPEPLTKWIKPPADRDFWVLEVPKAYEYRVHVFAGKAFRSGTKMLAGGTEFPDDSLPIWNLDNGCQIRYEKPAPYEARKLAIAAVSALKLDFGAVDVIKSHEGTCYFLECNTRPGLHGKTAVMYAEQIIKLL